MIYVTVKQNPVEKQISWLDLIGEEEISVNNLISNGAAGTVTRVMDQATPELLSKINVHEMINILKQFNETHNISFATGQQSSCCSNQMNLSPCFPTN